MMNKQITYSWLILKGLVQLILVIMKKITWNKAMDWFKAIFCFYWTGRDFNLAKTVSSIIVLLKSTIICVWVGNISIETRL